MITVFINGRFLTQRTTGVQRYAQEIVKGLDAIRGQWGDVVFKIVVPSDGLTHELPLNHIETIVLKGKPGYYWEQIRLGGFIKKQKGRVYLLNLCNLAPLKVGKRNLSTVHDVAFIDHPEFYSKKFVLAYKFLIKRIVRKSTLVFTVTQDSKKRITATYSINPNKIIVTGNGYTESLLNESEQIKDSIRALPDHGYLFSVGSASPNKNLKYIVSTAKKNPEALFIVAGGNNSLFAQLGVEDLPSNVRHLGYVNDAELGFCYRHAYAFVFPSIYEGFGIPPIEAVYCGCRRLVISDIPVLREVLSGCDVNYIDPLDFTGEYFPKELRSLSEEQATSLLQTYTWRKFAVSILDSIHKIAE